MSEPTARDLETLRSFVNTAEPDAHTDEVDTPDRLYDWLVERSLLAVDATIDEKAHREALEFREAIRALALANGARELDPSAIVTLNRIAAGAELSVVLDSDGRAELHGVGRGLDQTLGQLLSILYTAMVDGSFLRLKGCADDTCKWLFYDRSKNRSKKWCEMEACGNVNNARAYRQRNRDRALPPNAQEKR